MEIIIKKNQYGSLFAHTKKDGAPLFQFEYRTPKLGGPGWYFWLRGNYDPDIFKGTRKNFPMDFFTRACRAKSFIRFGFGIDDTVSIVKGKEYLEK